MRRELSSDVTCRFAIRSAAPRPFRTRGLYLRRDGNLVGGATFPFPALRERAPFAVESLGDAIRLNESKLVAVEIAKHRVTRSTP